MANLVVNSEKFNFATVKHVVFCHLLWILRLPGAHVDCQDSIECTCEKYCCGATDVSRTTGYHGSDMPDTSETTIRLHERSSGGKE